MRGREAKVQQLRVADEQRRLSREELLLPKMREQEIFIPGLDGTIKVRSITHGLRKELRVKCGFQTPDYDDDLFTRLIMVHSIVDPPLTEEDLTALEEQNATVFDELIMHLTLFNAGVDEVKKDSSQTESSDSPSS